MSIIEEIIQNQNFIIGLLLQGVGIVIYDRLASIIHLSFSINSSTLEKPSAKEKTAINLACNVEERLKLLRRYIAIHLVLDLTTIVIGPWYIFAVLIPMISLIQLSFLIGLKSRGYFHSQLI